MRKATAYSYAEYQTLKINKMKEKLHIRARLNSENKRIHYWYGILEMDSIGYSDIHNGCFVMSSKLKQFVERMRLA